MIKSAEFESNIQNRATPIAINFNGSRQVLLMVFGGLFGQFGIPMFEFHNLTSGLENVNTIYLRDVNKLWYHRGLPNIGGNVESIASFLGQYTTHECTRRTVIFGNSGGGYAAILFGHMLQVDEVHAFSPKTFIDPIRRVISGDTRPWRQMRALWVFGQKRYFDLKPILLASPKGKTHFHIYYSTDDKIDRLHATRLESISGVHLHPYAYGQHDLVRLLKKSGELSQIIEQSIQLA